MSEFIYTTWTRRDNEWVKDMLNGWMKSKKRYLCFPWIKFNIHTLNREPFWLYMYYALKDTDIVELVRAIEYRIHVVEWNSFAFKGNEIFLARGQEDGKIWFLCDQFQEIRNTNGELITLDDFSHYQGKSLPSTMRNSIPRVISETDIKVVQQNP